MVSGRSSKAPSLLMSTSSAGSVSSDKASCMRRRRLQRARRGAATLPTCEDFSFRRREWKASPSGSVTGAIAVPAELAHRRLKAGDPQRQRKSIARAAGVQHHIRLAAGGFGCGELDARGRGDRRALRIDVDQFHLAPGHARAARRARQPTLPAADHRDPIARRRARVPDPIQRRLHDSPRARPRWRHHLGQHDTAHRQATDVLLLMGIQTEHVLPRSCGGSLQDSSDACIAVFDGRRKLPRLERCAHALVFALGHPAA